MVCLLNISSTTEPEQRCIGSVVELTINKRVIQGSIPGSEWRVHTVGPAIFALFLALSVPNSTPPPFALLATLAFFASGGKYYVISVPTVNHVWIYSKLADVLEECRVRAIVEYIHKHRNTIAMYVATLPILEMCREGKRRRGLMPRQWWWEQPMSFE
jgi:hypothetical protein